MTCTRSQLVTGRPWILLASRRSSSTASSTFSDDPQNIQQRSDEKIEVWRQELLRVDGGGVDTAYTDTQLARNFEKLAFFAEYKPFDGLQLMNPIPDFTLPAGGG